MASNATTRYDGRPFLRLLESYLLDAIDQLGDEPRASLEAIRPKLAKIFGLDGTWQEIVRAQMEFPESMSEQIRFLWEGYLLHARQHGLSVSPNEFVEQFVNQNFSFIFEN